MTSPIALVTGASSGIGREAALALASRGVTVYAAARRQMPDLAERGICTLRLDVTDDDSMRAAITDLLAHTDGRVDILVNNAGYGSYGAIEDVPLDEARRQFDVNVFGAMRLVQLVVPAMTERGSGRIINVSSMGGRFALALGGWYHATKYAVEALSDALRQEVGPLGVDVVVIEPGLIHTNWSHIAAEHLRSTSGLGKYSSIAQGFATILEFADGRVATDPSVIGGLIAHAATTSRPRTRYRKGLGAWSGVTAATLLPDRVFDTGVRLLLDHSDDLVGFLRRTLG